jgi:hypothetical protein
MAGHSKMAGLSNLIDYGRITAKPHITRKRVTEGWPTIRE